MTYHYVDEHPDRFDSGYWTAGALRIATRISGEDIFPRQIADLQELERMYDARLGSIHNRVSDRTRRIVREAGISDDVYEIGSLDHNRPGNGGY